MSADKDRNHSSDEPVEGDVSGHDRISDSESAERTCSSCLAPVKGKFCHECGQKHRNHPPRFFSFLGESIGTLFEADGPVPRTVSALLLHPGELSRAYYDGRLSQYVSPARVFIVSSAIYFLISNFLSTRSILFLHLDNVETADQIRGLLETGIILLQPVFGAILALVRIGSRQPYLAHLVCAIHVQSVFFLVFSLVFVLNATIIQWVGLGEYSQSIIYGTQLVCIFYLGAELKRAYAIPWWRAVIDTMIVLVLYILSYATIIKLQLYFNKAG